MAHDVFVSHSSKDKSTADAVCAVLESKSIRCWIAPRDIRPGDDWGEAILEGIRGSKVMVLVFSRNANESVQIKREVERAVHHGIPIIPLRIEDILPTGTLEFSISTSHWLDAFTPPMERHLSYLADTVRAILDRKPVPLPLPKPGPPSWMNFAIAGGVVFGGLLLWLLVHLMFPPSIKGNWNLSTSNLTAAQNSAIADLMTPALTPENLKGTLAVKGLNEYTATVTGTDSGTVKATGNINAPGGIDSKALVFTSNTSHKDVTITYDSMENNGAWNAFGVSEGERMLLFGVNAGAGEVILHGNAPDSSNGGNIPAMVLGTWAGTPFNMNPPNNLWSGSLAIHADGTYVITVTHAEAGILDAANGNWAAKPGNSGSGNGMPMYGMYNGLFLSGHYKFSGSSELEIVTDNGSFTFRRGW